MLVFFIHGVNTKNSGYADKLVRNIRKELAKKQTSKSANFYSSFWGNLFNNKKHQTTEYIEKDFSRTCAIHQEYKNYYHDIYRYKEWRNQLIGNFLGDFLIYQNPDCGQAIRKVVFEQLNQFVEDHLVRNQEIHVVAHSLGSIVLWDLTLFKRYD